MPMWVQSPHNGGKSIPPAVRLNTERRIREYADKQRAGKFTRIDVRFRGAFCYIDAYTEPGAPPGWSPPEGETREQWLQRLRDTPTHLCRIRYFGDADRWSFSWYTYAQEKYEPSFLMSGDQYGTPEEAFETSTLFL